LASFDRSQQISLICLPYLDSHHALQTKWHVAIPNDPVNLARALILLHRAGLIQLKDV